MTTPIETRVVESGNNYDLIETVYDVIDFNVDEFVKYGRFLQRVEMLGHEGENALFKLVMGYTYEGDLLISNEYEKIMTFDNLPSTLEALRLQTTNSLLDIVSKEPKLHMYVICNRVVGIGYLELCKLMRKIPGTARRLRLTYLNVVHKDGTPVFP